MLVAMKNPVKQADSETETTVALDDRSPEQLATPASEPPPTPLEAQSDSPWLPLKNPVFRTFWLASLVSNLGTWMHEIGAGWLMTQLDASPQMVSAVRTSMALPIMLLAIPAGVLADRMDRRKLLIGTQLMLLCVTGTLAWLTAMGWITAWGLLGLTFLIGLGLTLHVPTWQASVPEWVPRSQLSRAVALGSISFNLARGVGPALAGLLVAWLGSWIAFSFNAASFAAVIIALLVWKRDRVESSRGQSFQQSLFEGLHYAFSCVAMRHVLLRLLFFVAPASALWGLLPLIVKQRLDWGADGFGVLVACIGGGAIIGARLMPELHRWLGADKAVTMAMTLFAIGMTLMSVTTDRTINVVATLIMGMGWMITLTSLNTAAQLSLPDRLRARGMSCYLTMMAFSMATGSLLWGMLADSTSIATAQKIAATTVLVTAAIGLKLSIISTPEPS